MGGQNHQPCRKYLAISTFMSRAASLAFAELQLANVSLEDLLLAELNGNTDTVDDILIHLQSSSTHLESLQDTVQELRAEMDIQGYQDLPSIHRINLEAIGVSFAEAGAVNDKAWAEVSERMKKCTFYAILSDFADSASVLLNQTKVLNQKIASLQSHAINGNVLDVVEKNHQDNFKVEFARLYTSWNKFQMKFLASALLSTEVYYAFNDYGTLCPNVKKSAVA